MKNVLMIDDDPSLGSRLTDYFLNYGIQLTVCGTPSEGLRQLAISKPELILLDVNLPEQDGFSLCKQIRANYTLPIIMLTARGELTDKVLGLEIGADDYLAKPFEPRELVARVNALLRRGTAQPERNLWRFSGLDIYPEHHRVVLDGVPVTFTGMEFKLLCCLAKQPGQVLSRDELLNAVKGVDVELYSRSIDILLSRIRSKLDDNANQPRFIKTIRNAGYCFIGRQP